MKGMIFAPDGKKYEIVIPSPYAKESKKEAIKDGDFGYRFIWNEVIKEPVIAIFERDDFCEITECRLLKIYKYQDFVKHGGTVKLLEHKGHNVMGFKEIFPYMKKGDLNYISKEAFWFNTVAKEDEDEN